MDIIRRGSTVDRDLLNKALKEHARIVKCRSFKKNRMHKIVRQRGTKALILRSRIIFNRFGEEPGQDRPYSDYMSNLHRHYNANIVQSKKIPDTIIQEQYLNDE